VKRSLGSIIAAVAVLAVPGEAAAETRPAPATGAAPLRIGLAPGLQPAFRRSRSDFVTRCAGRGSVRLAVRGPRGTSVGVRGRRLGRGAVRLRLAPGERIRFVVRSPRQRTVHHVRCLPADFPRFDARRSGPTRSRFYLVTPSLQDGPLGASYVAIFDSAGAPVWWMRDEAPSDARLLADGNLAWVTPTEKGVGTDPTAAYEIHRLDGRLLRRIAAIGTPTDQHDLEPLRNGNHLVLAYRPRDGADLSDYGGPSSATVLDGEVQEVTPDGRVAWSWSSKDHIGLAETGRWFDLHVIGTPTKLRDGRSGYDIVHLNSIEARGDTVVVVARHLDAVYAISRSTGRIKWKLGGTRRPESLRVLGDRAPAGQLLGGPHDARLLGDGTLTLYDNGHARGRPPRALRLRIDERAGTARVIEDLRYRPARSSLCCGSARRLRGGNWLVNWADRPLITELTARGQLRFRLRFRGVFSYRAFPIRPGRLSHAGLRRGMDAMARQARGSSG
jgi:hypothetical protein